MVEFKDIMGSLRSLSRTQLEAVRKQAAYHLQHQSSRGSAPVEEEDWLLLGLLTELRRRGLDGRDFKIKSSSSFAGFQTQSVGVRELLLTAVPGLSAVQRRLLGEIAGYELARYLESWSPPKEISRANLLMYVSRVPEAIDRAFPGYMAAGMLGLVVSGRKAWQTSRTDSRPAVRSLSRQQ